jgi:hypothetical protein
MEYFNENLSLRKTKKWDVGNTTTIVDWISVSNLNILILDAYLIHLRRILGVNTLWSLVISSITSTISVTQFTINDTTEPVLSFWIKVIIFISSIFTSLITGYIKVQKIQETIEMLEEHKSKWMTFMYSLLSEIQVGINFRKSATDLINSKKEEFNNVNSKQFMIPKTVRLKVSKFLTGSAIDNMKEKNPSCYQRFCEWSLCCVKDNFEIKTIKLTKKKLSLYYSINRELKKELLELLLYFPDIVEEINFNEDTDMFQYEINNKYFNKEKNDETVVILDDPVKSKKNYSKFTSRIQSQTVSTMPKTSFIPPSATSTTFMPSPVPVYQSSRNLNLPPEHKPIVVDMDMRELELRREERKKKLKNVIEINDLPSIEANIPFTRSLIEDFKNMLKNNNFGENIIKDIHEELELHLEIEQILLKKQEEYK